MHKKDAFLKHVFIFGVTQQFIATNFYIKSINPMRRILILTSVFSIMATVLFGQTASNFSITDINGEQHDLYQDYLDNDKVVLLFIMQSFDPGSNAIAADVQKMYQSWGAGRFGLQLLALSNNVNDTDLRLINFKNQYNITFPLSSAEGGSVTASETILKEQLRSGPLFILIKENKEFIYDIKGDDDASTLKLIEENLLQIGSKKPFVMNGSIQAHGKPVKDVWIKTSESLNSEEAVITDGSGDYEVAIAERPENQDFAFIPYRNDRHDNGLSTLDAVIILRHLLGLQRFDNPEDHIRSDIDNSGSITALDVVALRRMLIRLDSSFANNTSWRFVPTDYKFQDPTNPLKENFPESISIRDVEELFVAPDFNALKIGDLNASANSQLTNPNVRQKMELSYFTTMTDTEVSYHFMPGTNKQSIGFQFGLLFDSKVLSNPTVSQGQIDFSHKAFADFNVDQNGRILISWNDIEPLQLDEDEPLFSITFQREHSLYPTIALDQNFSGEFYSDLEHTSSLVLKKEKSIINLDVFPNPTADILNLNFGSPFIGHLEILSASGQKLGTWPIVNEITRQVNLSELSPGIYHVYLMADDKAPIVQKVIKH